MGKNFNSNSGLLEFGAFGFEGKGAQGLYRFSEGRGSRLLGLERV